VSSGRASAQDYLASQRAEWEQQALQSLAASSAQSRAQASRPPPSSSAADGVTADSNGRTLTGSATGVADGMSAREKHALERRKRKALVALRRSMIASKEARKDAFMQAHQPQQQPQMQSLPPHPEAGGWMQI